MKNNNANYGLGRVHRFNVGLIGVFSLILSAQAFSVDVNNGLMVLAVTAGAFVLAWVTSQFNLPDRLGAVLIPIYPFVAGLTLSHLRGGDEKLFILYSMLICVSALYFRRDTLVIYSGIVITTLSIMFVVSPNSLLNASYATFSEFISRMAIIVAGATVLYFLTSWGKEAILQTEKERAQANRISEQLNEIASQVEHSINATSSTSEELSGLAEEGSSAISQTKERMEEIDLSIKEIAASLNRVNVQSNTSEQQIAKGQQNVAETVDTMEKISDSVGQTLGAIKELDSISQEIGGIVSLINGIAEQTNMLALNAAVEAARAGESGKGFAVVAEEVRRLAEETGKATENVANLIDVTQKSAGKGLSAIKAAVAQSQAGKDVATKTKNSFASIKESNSAVKQEIDGAVEITRNVAISSQDILRASGDINAMSEEIAHSSQALAKLAADLKKLTAELAG